MKGGGVGGEIERGWGDLLADFLGEGLGGFGGGDGEFLVEDLPAFFILPQCQMFLSRSQI